MKKLPIATVILSLLILFSLININAVSVEDQNWDVQTINSPDSSVYNPSSLVLDSRDNPHFTYMVDGNNSPILKYAFWTGSEWNIQTLDNGTQSSLVLDSHDNPHISYLGNRGLEYASWNGSAWNVQVVDEQSVTDSSLALDLAGNPHISYIVLKNPRWNHNGYYDYDYFLNYAYWDNSGWHLQTVESFGQYYGRNNFLLLDSEGNPHILYNYYGVKYASWNGLTWDKQVVDPNGSVDNPFVLDSHDEPAMVFLTYSETDSGSNILDCVTRSELGWSNQIIDKYVNFPVSVAEDPNDNLHIIYSVASNLSYASWTGSVWSVKTVSTNFDCLSLSLVLDSNDKPHILYTMEGDNSKISLKYAFNVGASNGAATFTHLPNYMVSHSDNTRSDNTRSDNTYIYIITVGLVVLAVLLLLQRKRRIKKSINFS
jgi:hypothetical protein